MSEETKIAWTDHTFNPWIGCSKVSEGCRHCYAEELNEGRFKKGNWGPHAFRRVTKDPWKNVLKWNKLATERTGALVAEMPNLVFTGSMCDWAEDRDELVEPRLRMWELIKSCKNLHFQMLTKRPENIARFLPEDWGDGYENVWLGTSIEDMRVAERVDSLRAVNSSIRFISYEPALGPLNDLDLSGIDWVIYGGESGPNFRPEKKQWARDMRDMCRAHGIAFFHKQSAGRFTETGIELDGEIVREFPQCEMAVAV